MADLQGLEHVLLHQEHGDPLARDALHGLEDLGDQLGHDPQGGLVQHEQFGPAHEPPGDRHLLLLAAGKCAGALVGARLDPGEQPQDRLQAFGDLLLGFHGVGPQQQVVLHRQAREKPPPLRHQSDLFLDDVVGRLAGDHLVVQADLALRRLEQAQDGFEQRGLAGAVGADQRNDLTAFDLKRDILDGQKPLVPHG